MSERTELTRAIERADGWRDEAARLRGVLNAVREYLGLPLDPLPAHRPTAEPVEVTTIRQRWVSGNANFKEILRRIRAETAWEPKCRVVEGGGVVSPLVEIVDAEMDTICFAHEEESGLLLAIFDWLLDEAEHDPDR